MELTLRPNDEVFLVGNGVRKYRLRSSSAKELKAGDVFKVVRDGASYKFTVRARLSKHVDAGAIVLDSESWHIVCKNGVGLRVLKRLSENCPFSEAFLPREIEFPDGLIHVADIEFA